ncbi:MAG: alkaline phosphatase D family protein [Opitutales bacterium]
MRQIIFSLLIFSTLAHAKFPERFDSALETVAFGSCNRDELPQPVWPAVEAHKPDLWIWGGDNIYADWYAPPEGPKIDYTVNREWLIQRYAAQFNRPDYAAFRKKTPIIGTWDDHDYGRNNAGADYPLKAVSRDLALTFMEVPLSDPRWTREGLYGSYDFGPAGRRTRIILTDNRYFASSPKSTDATMLGSAQKEWIEKQLRESGAELHLIVSGSQFISDQHRWDSWQKYEEEREWLLELIRETEQRVVFLSGDRHIHEISVLNDPSLPYPLVDITSSGLTHSWENFPGEANPHRHGDVFAGLGFGLIRIDWSGESPRVHLEIRDAENQLQNKYSTDFEHSPQIDR